MALPTTAGGLPQPAGGFPAFAPLPYLGLTRDERELQATVPGVASAPTRTSGPAPLDPVGRMQALGWVADLTGGAIGPGNDPAQWTPEEAAAQTDRALARIAQVNPELAQTLAAQHGKSQGEDLPWYKDIMKGVGDFLHATKLDVVFDYLGRASHVVPEVIHDWGKESFWTNVGQALNGEVTTNWNTVFQDWGWEGDGVGGFARAALGFVGDVLTDPLTYATFGMGGIGRQAVGKTVTEAGIAAALKEGRIGVTRIGETVLRYGDDAVDLSLLLKEMQAAYPKASIDDLAKLIFQQTEAGQKLAERGGAGLTSRIRSALGRVHPDAQPGAAFALDQMLSSDAMLQTVRLADDLYRTATTIGWQRTTAEAAARLGVKKEVVDEVLKGYVRQGTGFGIEKAFYQQGKAAAAGLGGARLRFSIPVLDIRAAGMRLPMLPAKLDFSIGRRLFAGLSGQVRLMKMVGEGAATLEDMRIFWEGGWSKLKELSPSVAKQVGGHHSMLYTVSEGLGNATKLFSPHHMQLRGGGLAAKYSGETVMQSRHIRAQTIDELQTITTRRGEVVRPDQLAERLGAATKNAGDRAVELHDALNDVAMLIPEPGRGAAEYWDSRLAAFELEARRLGQDTTQEYLDRRAWMQDVRDRAVVAEQKVKSLGGDEGLGELWSQLGQNKNKVEQAAGITPDQYNEAIVQVDSMHPEDAAEHSDGVTYRAATVTGDGSNIGIDQLTDNGVTGVPLRGLRGERVGTLADPGSVTVVDGATEAAQARLDDDPAAALRSALDDSIAIEEGAEATAEGADILARSRAATVTVQEAFNRAGARGQRRIIETAKRVLNQEFGDLEGEAADVLREAIADLERGDFGLFEAAMGDPDIAQMLYRELDPSGDAATIAFLQSANPTAAALPPPTAGTTRVFRGGDVEGDTGKWWTLDPNEAEGYAQTRPGIDNLGQEGKRGGVLYYRDIPTDELAAARNRRPAAIDSIEDLTPEEVAAAKAAGNRTDQDIVDHAVEARAMAEPQGSLVDERAAAMDDLHHFPITDHPSKIHQAPSAAPAPPQSPAARLMSTLPADAARIAEEQLRDLNPDDAAWLANPRVVVTGPRRTLTLDRRTVGQAGREAGTPSEATHIIDEVEEIQAAYRQVLDDIDEGAFPQLDDLPDDVAEEVRAIVQNAESREAQLADLTTVVLKSRGYTDVRVITDAGEEVVVLWDDVAGAVPVSRINPRAARLEQQLGSPLRAMTSGAREAIQGAKKAEAQELVTRIMRATKGATREEAERKARTILREAGVGDLRPGQSVFETNPLRVMEEASNDTASKVQRQFVGEAMRHAENIGLMRGGYGAQAVGIGKKRVILNEGAEALGTVAEATTARRKAEEVIARLADAEIPRLTRQVDKFGDEYLEAQRVLGVIIENEQARITGILNHIRDNTTAERFLGAGPEGEQVIHTGELPGNPRRLRLGNTADDPATRAAKRAKLSEVFELGNDPNYGYHFGRAENMGDVRSQGLKPGMNRDITPPGPDGVYFGQTAKDAYDGLPMGNAKDTVVYRVRRDLIDMQGTGRGAGFERELYTGETVPPGAIEYLDDDGLWKPLNSVDREAFESAGGEAVARADRIRTLDRLTETLAGLRGQAEALTSGRVALVRPSKRLKGGSIYRIGNKANVGDRVTYVLVDESGQVVSARQLGASITDNVERNVNGVWTRPEFERQGFAGELADAHWDDMEITSGTWEEQYDKMARAIAQQEFTGSGAGQAEKYVKRNAARIKSEAKKRAEAARVEAERAQRQLDYANMQLTADQAEYNRLIARQQSARAPLLASLVPAAESANMTGMSVVRLKGFEGFAMPSFMAEEFERAMRGFPKLEGAHLAFRQLNNFWKQFATWLVPGFHIRNFEGAFFNNWLGGVGLRDYVTSARIRYAAREIESGNLNGKWANRLLSEADPELLAGLRFGNPGGYLNGVPLDELTYADLASLTAGLNINASNGRAFAEAMMTAEAQTRRVQKAAKGRGAKGYIQRIPTPYTKLMRGAGTMTENFFRGASWVRGLREGRTVMESRAFTMMRHGDYEDLTDVEYLWVRDLIPFYKWMRTNTPFQIHQLLESPGKLLAVQKAQRAVYDAQGLDYEAERHRMPKWMSEGFTVPYNIGEKDGQTVFDTVMLDLPMSDLFMGGREFISSFLPTVRPFLESYITEQQTFTGAPLKGKQVPVNPLFGPLLPVLDAVGLVSTGPNGQRYMSDKTQNLLGIIPLYSRFKHFIFADEKSVDKRMGLVASGVFGLQMRPVDVDQLTQAELNFYYDQVLPSVEYLRGVGYELPTTADLEETVGTTDSILRRLGIEPGLAAPQAA